MTTCWRSEYDWKVSRRPDSQFRETVLSVLFDNGAQREFSGVHISLLLGKDATPEHRTAWQITPTPSSLSVVNQDRPITQNNPSLPICRIIFIADWHSARSQSKAVEVARLCGEILLAEPSTPSGDKLFEFDHPLTEITQSVSVSFTSSYMLSTTIPHGVFSNPFPNQPAMVGRVVRVVAASKRKTIPLPTDVLIIIFEDLRSPLTYRGWRRDLLNCALVCREWTCALNLLLIDFRSQDCQHGHPPEVFTFANTLVARPILGLEVKYLSAGYLEKHPTWDPFPVLPSGTPSPMFLAKLQLQQSNVRRSRFAKAFLSILQVTKNVRTLSLDTANALVVSPNDLAEALSGLAKLDAFKGKCTLSMAQLLSCISTWPSLKRLTILSVLPPSARGAPLPSLTCRLTELVLVDVQIKDDELACLVNPSSKTLQRLSLDHIAHLTNAGLGVALTTVCGSLAYLRVTTGALARGEEEHALDAVIVRMERLAELEIVPDVASERMLVRRAEAFVHQHASAVVVPGVHLRLMVGGDAGRDGGLLGAAERDWPGWKIDHGLRT